MEKRKYYKLGPKSSVFSDYSCKLKVTKNVPGSTVKHNSKTTKEAIGNGHIIEIDKEEFDKMMSRITPEERKCAYEEQGLGTLLTPTDEGEEEDEEEGIIDPKGGTMDKERQDLLERLEKIKMPKGKRSEIKDLPTPELKAFIENEEKE